MKPSKKMEYDFNSVADQSAVPHHLRGKKMRIIEAPTDMMVEIRKVNQKESVRYDPHRCELAVAFKARYNIDYIFVGSGANAYSHFVGDDFVVHHTIKNKEAWSRDNYDASGQTLEPGTLVVLHRPSPAMRLDSVKQRTDKTHAARRAGLPPTRPGRKKVKTRKFVYGINHRVRAPVKAVKR
jgi:hypothetical protein